MPNKRDRMRISLPNFLQSTFLLSLFRSYKLFNYTTLDRLRRALTLISYLTRIWLILNSNFKIKKFILLFTLDRQYSNNQFKLSSSTINRYGYFDFRSRWSYSHSNTKMRLDIFTTKPLVRGWPYKREPLKTHSCYEISRT
jgi:hypothetical protein